MWMESVLGLRGGLFVAKAWIHTRWDPRTTKCILAGLLHKRDAQGGKEKGIEVQRALREIVRKRQRAI